MKKDQEVMNKNNEFNVEEDMPNLTSDLNEKKEKSIEKHHPVVKDGKYSKSKKKQTKSKKKQQKTLTFNNVCSNI